MLLRHNTCMQHDDMQTVGVVVDWCRSAANLERTCRPYLFADLLIYSLTPWSRVLLEKLTVPQLVKKFPAFYGNQRFITAFTNVRHLSLFLTSSIQSTPSHPTSWRSILTLSSHLRLGLPSGFFPSGFPTKTLYTPVFSSIRAACPTHLILLDLITRTVFGEQFRSSSCTLCSGLHCRKCETQWTRTLPEYCSICLMSCTFC